MSKNLDEKLTAAREWMSANGITSPRVHIGNEVWWRMRTPATHPGGQLKKWDVNNGRNRHARIE